jgi:hypothetical protein
MGEVDRSRETDQEGGGSECLADDGSCAGMAGEAVVVSGQEKPSSRWVEGDSPISGAIKEKERLFREF